MPIYIGTQKIDVSGIEKVYVGTQLVYQGGVAVQSIALSGYTTEFNVGNTFSFGGTVIATYSDGTTADVTSSTVFSGYNMSTSGSQTVTASYTESGVIVTATYNITVYKVLSSITISGQTTSLARDSTFSFGGTVTAHYNDNTTADVTSSSTFTGYNMATAGTYTVKVNYTYRSVTKQTTYSLTVTKAWSTIWTGTKTMTFGSSTPNYIEITNPNVTGEQQFRITFTMSRSGSSSGWKDAYYLNGDQQSAKPSSPVALAAFDTTKSPTTKVNKLGIRYRNSGDNYYKQINLRYKAHNASSPAGFYLTALSQSGPSNVTLTMTVTKIERYY